MLALSRDRMIKNQPAHTNLFPQRPGLMPIIKHFSMLYLSLIKPQLFESLWPPAQPPANQITRKRCFQPPLQPHLPSIQHT